MIPSFLSAFSLDSAWLVPVYYAVRAYDGMEEFNRTDSLLADAHRRLATLPQQRSELETLARARAESRGAIGSTSLPPAGVLLMRQPTATGAQFYETAREYYASSRPAEAAMLLARIDSAGGILSPTDGSSYWLRGLALHSSGEYGQEMELARERFERSVSGISHTEYFDYMRALAATGRSSEIPARFDDLPSDILEGDQYIGFGFQLAGEVAFHGDSAVAHALFERLARACELRARALVYYRPRCAFAHIAVGDTSVARTWVERLEHEDVDPLTLLGTRGLVAAAAGRNGEARAALERIAAYRDNLRQGRPDFWRARILASMGDREGAIAALADAKENGWFPFWGMHGYFHFYPELASLKDDPRVRPYWLVDDRPY
jgi:tetratricopeptide (TPR) repeat protein